MKTTEERYIGTNGEIITGDMLDTWAEEAEGGFEGYAFDYLPAEELPHMRGKMSTHTIRIPDSMWNLAQEQAQANGTTIASYVREAIADKILANA